ncbi:MAG: hypothetical protein QOE68_1735, partial [Thermoanaerobaculia bacterium]|nr:hypothetical protein [Thermoanaerobaculia bacterium]
MRKLLLAVLLFQTVDAFAQTVSAEIASGPLPFTNLPSFLAAPAVPMAKDRTGVAIVWLMPVDIGDRISVVRLDGTGHFTGQVQTIPTASSEPVYVVAPSLAAVPRGDGFTLAWLEIVSYSPPVTRAVYCRLDRDLKPSMPTVLTVIRQALTAPAIVRSGKTTTWISAGGSAWELRDDGSLSTPLNAGITATDMTVATDFPQIAGVSHAGVGLICPPGCGSGGRISFCNCPSVPPTAYSVQFTSLYSISASKIFDFDSDAAPAIGNDGRDAALVWLQGAHVKGGQVVMARLLPPSFTDFPTAINQFRMIGTFAPDSGPTRPDIASDGERYVVVWRTQTSDHTHDVVGASIDRAGNIIPLSIATSAADERDPSVLSMGDGTFLVAYEKFSNGERRIAGRIVTF